MGGGQRVARRDLLRKGSPCAMAYLGDAQIKFTHEDRMRPLPLYIVISTPEIPLDALRAKAVAYGSRVEMIFQMQIVQDPEGGRHLKWENTRWIVTELA
jgi:hypothetical protein